MPQPEQLINSSEEPAMTGAQRAYLKDLCKRAGEPFYEELTRTQASRKIEELLKAKQAQKV